MVRLVIQKRKLNPVYLIVLIVPVKAEEKKLTAIFDEYQRWCLKPVFEDEDASDLIVYLQGRQGTYPCLSIKTLEIVSIPAMSTKVEHVFSKYI